MADRAKGQAHDGRATSPSDEQEAASLLDESGHSLCHGTFGRRTDLWEKMELVHEVAERRNLEELLVRNRDFVPRYAVASHI